MLWMRNRLWSRPGRDVSRLMASLAVGLSLLAGLPAYGIGTDTLVADLSPAQETSAVSSSARGCGTFVIDRNANTLSYHISFTGLSSPESGAHIHGPAGPGTDGDTALTLPPGNPKVGVWNYPERLEEAILTGQMYINIHSGSFPAGEIRGQIGTHVAVLNGAQETPSPVGTTGSGWGTFWIDTDSNQLHYHIEHENLAGAETTAHIRGMALHGGSAGILHTLPAGNPKVGTYTYPESFESFILFGCTYVNINSTVAGGGEIRGQICNIVVPMDGQQEVPSVTTDAAGCAQIAIDPAGNVLSYHIQSFNLSAPENMAHIHGMAPPGDEAGVLHTLPAGQTKIGFWFYGAGQEPAVLAGQSYINIHTTAETGGEIRGQIHIGAKQPCDQDINGDGSVGPADLALLLGAWGPNPGSAADFTGDGIVGPADLAQLLGAWGECP